MRVGTRHKNINNSLRNFSLSDERERNFIPAKELGISILEPPLNTYELEDFSKKK